MKKNVDLLDSSKRYGKRASVREKIDTHRKNVKLNEKKWENRFSETQRTNAKFGIYKKGGYCAYEIYETREEAEKELLRFNWHGKKNCFEIREIIG